MRIALEIPDTVLRRAQSAAAQRGVPLQEFVTEAVRDKLATTSRTRQVLSMAAFGKLRHLHKETARINRLIEEEFGRVEATNSL